MILGYTLQLYFGLLRLLRHRSRLWPGSSGIRLPMNFDSPYRSASVTEFWKRWHITLTTFLRECVYIPPGRQPPGQRSGRIANILIVYPGQRLLARGRVDLPGLGTPSTAWPRWCERVWGRGRDRLPLWPAVGP